LEAKRLEVLKELVEYGNKNILGNFTLYLVMEERRGEDYAKELPSGILDIKPEDKGKGKEKQEEAVNQEQHHHNGSNNNNQSWSTRLRDKSGRFMSSNTKAATTASNTTTAVAITTMPIIATAKPPSSHSWHNNKLRDNWGRFVASTAAT
jgi:hypothetical protein